MLHLFASDLDVAALLGCLFLLAIAALSLYTARVVLRIRDGLPVAEERMLREARRASLEARDAAALARAEVDGLRIELDDALSEVVGRLSAGGMDVTTGVDDDDAPTDPRVGAPASGRVLVGPWGAQ